MHVELGVELRCLGLPLPAGLAHPCVWQRFLRHVGGYLRALSSAVGDTVGEFHIVAEYLCEHTGEQLYMVLLEHFIYKPVHLHQNCPGAGIERFEHDRLKPGFILLLRNASSDERKALVPKSIRT